MVLVKENQGVTWLTRFTWKIAVKMVCGYMCNNILLHQLQRRSAPPYGTVWLRKDFSFSFLHQLQSGLYCLKGLVLKN